MQQQASTTCRAGLFFASLAAWGLALIMALRGKLRWAAILAMLALAADTTGRSWSRKSPVAMPYFMWWVLLLPRGPQSAKQLIAVLRPRSGERILEVGPGVGVHALPMAAAMLPDGVLDVLDMQQEMLDHLMRRAADRGLTNIVPAQGDAQRLPYPDGAFDAAYLFSVLGEIPDGQAALRELRRVLKPDGRLLVGEVVLDPDFISLRKLQTIAVDAGFAFAKKVGPSFAYSALFEPAAAAE